MFSLVSLLLSICGLPHIHSCVEVLALLYCTSVLVNEDHIVCPNKIVISITRQIYFFNENCVKVYIMKVGESL